MKNNTIELSYKTFKTEDLPVDLQKLVDKAKRQTELSYAPYSNFKVGAAILLDNGDIICGNNQENVAFPSGICAERTAMFYANSQYPDIKPIAIAIAARNANDEFLDIPISPCGSCRQSLLESEIRYNSPIKVILYGKKAVFVIDRVSDMLPFAFKSLD